MFVFFNSAKYFLTADMANFEIGTIRSLFPLPLINIISGVHIKSDFRSETSSLTLIPLAYRISIKALFLVFSSLFYPTLLAEFNILSTSSSDKKPGIFLLF